MPQSELYKRSNKVDYVGGMPGTRVSEDLMIVRVDSGKLDIKDRANRVLGNIDITDIPEPVQTTLYEALKSEGTDSLLVQEDNPLDVTGATVPVQEDTPLDVSASTVVVQEDTPLDVSGAIVSVQEDTPLDVSGAEVDVDLSTQSLSELASNISQIGGQAQSAVDVANAIDQIQGALASVGNTTMRVSSPNPLDVSGATVTVQEENPVETKVTGLPPVKKTENYGADIETDFTATLNVGEYSLVGIAVNADVNSNITVERSWDQNTWFTAEEYNDAGSVDSNLKGASGEYYRVTVAGTGTAGDTADVVISAKSR